MSAVSPTHEGLSHSTKHMAWWLTMYNTACSIAIQKLPYVRVRQLVKLDKVKEPMEEGETFTQFQSKAPLQMQQLMGSMTGLCRDAAIANESLRILFSSQGKHLEPTLYAATKLKPRSGDPSCAVSMAYAGVLTCCDFAEERALSTVGAAARLEKYLDDEVLESGTAFVDIVCSVAGSRVGRALLGQFLVDLKKSRHMNRKHAVVTAAVSTEAASSFAVSDLKRSSSRAIT